MRLRVIATDYDGTIATDGVLHPAVWEAIASARRRGVLVVLVTGRILSELRSVAGCLDFVDGVVCENGAVVALPTGHTTLLGTPPPLCLIEHLTRRRIDFKVGRCVVEMDAEFAHAAIALIREMKLPLAITFNRGRMMMLPASISKSSGLRYLLDSLGVSCHNAIGIGDAENDHELLLGCEYGVAVSWGSPHLQAMADDVIAGDGPKAVAEYIERVSAGVRMPAESTGHRRIILEQIDGRQPLEILIRGRNVLIAGDSKSGKSWLAGRFAEQHVLQGYTVYVFDPEGDYCSLCSLPNTVVLGGGRLLPHHDDLKMLLQQGISVVLNLSHLSYDDKHQYVRYHLPLVAEHRRARGFPHRIFLDECHYFLGESLTHPLLDQELNGYTLVTYRPSQLAAEVLSLVDVVAVTRLAEPNEVDVLRDLVDARSGGAIDSHDWYEQLANLGLGQAALLPPTREVGGQLRQFVVAPRLSTHVRHRSKYFEVPVSPVHAFVFTDDGRPTGDSAATLRDLAAALERNSEQVLTCHSRRHDFSRWVATLFCDQNLAKELRHMEAELNHGGSIAVFIQGLREAIEKRYDNNWPTAT